MFIKVHAHWARVNTRCDGYLNLDHVASAVDPSGSGGCVVLTPEGHIICTVLPEHAGALISALNNYEDGCSAGQ
jgi:hypothetical protein